MDYNERQSIILRTEDAGDTWKPVTHPIINNGDWSMLTDVSFSDPMNGWASGQIGWLLHTVDGGEKWVKKSINASVLLSSVFCLDSENIWVSELTGGAGATFFRTTNGFESWESHATGIKSLTWDMYFMNADTGIAALGWCSACPWSGNEPDSGGYILRTTNGGIDWTVQKHDTTIYGYFRIYFLNDTTGYVAGSDGSLILTDDGGVNWSEMTSGTDVDIWGVYFPNRDTGIITTGIANGSNGTIYRTTDGGVSWTQPDINGTNRQSIFALGYTEECTLFAPQERCNILRSTDCGETWEVAMPGCIPGGIDVISAPVLNIYPNPVGNLLTVEINDPCTEELVIEIFNVTGKVVYRKDYRSVNIPFSEQIDLSGFVGGVYLVKCMQSDRVYLSKVIVR